jgi:glycosyltransferase involved in cell wall biosynthesis
MISAIVLSKNNADTLENCLESIINSDGKKEIIVVDAHSTDRTPQILKKYHEKIRVIYDEGRGIGIARNLGTQNAKGEIICFVDADAICSREHFVRIEKFFDEHPEVGIVHAEGVIKFSEASSFIQRMEGKLRWVRKIMGSDVVSEEGSLVGGFFISFRKKVFDEVNGFWEFPPYGADDLDFSMKVLTKGWKVGVVNLNSWHSQRTTFRELFKEMWGWGKGKACWIKKWMSHPLTIKRYKDRKAFQLLGKNFWCYTVIAYLFSPFVALKYVPKTRSLGFYLFCVLRQYIYLLGFLWGWVTWARKMTPIRPELQALIF